MALETLITISLTIACPIMAGLGEGLRIKDVIKYSANWHILQWIERVLIYSSAAANYLLHPFWTATAYTALFAVAFFILYDGVINLTLGKSFFYVSPTSKAITEQYAHWYIKLPMLIVVIIINILTGRKQK